MITVPIEVSARHVHLDPDSWEQLFGEREMTIEHPISQTTQFVAKERVLIRGPKDSLSNIGIVGPLRPYTQVELAATDARRLGITPPLSDSGHLDHAAQITIVGSEGETTVAAAIIQQRHIHASPEDAERYGLKDGQVVSVQVAGQRGGTLDQVLVRINANYIWRMHLDTDEANGLGINGPAEGFILV